VYFQPLKNEPKKHTEAPVTISTLIFQSGKETDYFVGINFDRYERRLQLATIYLLTCGVCTIHIDQ
jgi:hypothetical protein